MAWLQFISWSFFDSKPLKLENGDRDREARRTRAMKPPRSDRRCGHVEAYRGIGRRPAGRQWGLERACRRIGGSVTAARREMTRRSPTNPAPPIPFPLSPPRCCAPPLVLVAGGLLFDSREWPPVLTAPISPSFDGTWGAIPDHFDGTRRRLGFRIRYCERRITACVFFLMLT